MMSNEPRRLTQKVDCKPTTSDFDFFSIALRAISVTLPTFAPKFINTMAKVKRIVVHCAATRAGDPVTREDLRHHFFEVKGWSHWGYHAVVYCNGSWDKLQQWPKVTTDGGIITDATRANGAKGYNDDSLHIAYVGGLDRATRKPADTRTDAQKNTLRMLISYWKTVYKITEVVGHRDLPGVNKACPCFDAKTEYQNA